MAIRTPSNFRRSKPLSASAICMPATRRNLFTLCTLCPTLYTICTLPATVTHLFSLPPLPHSSRRLDPGQKRKLQLPDHRLALESREVAWKTSRFLNRSFPSCTATLKRLLRLDTHAVPTCSSTDIHPTLFLASHVTAYAISNQPANPSQDRILRYHKG